MPPITNKARKEAARLFVEEHLTTQQVADRLHISQKSASNILQDNKENVEVNKGGRPRKLTVKDAEMARLFLKQKKARSAPMVTRMLNERLTQPVSAQTVRRALRNIGMDCGKKTKRPALKPQHKEARRRFAIKYREWTLEDWKRVVFSDESKFNRISSDGMQYFWDDRPDPNTQRKVAGTVKFGGGSVKVWSCFSWHGPGYIVMVDDTMNAELYRTILQEDLQASLEEWDMRPGDFIFQHDNDRKHTSRLVKEYLRSVHLTEEEGTLLTWPAQSPDLNPIEHMWSELERRLAAYSDYPSSCKELWERIAKEWYSIPQDFCQTLIRSMHSRLAAVYRAKGGNTRY